jgi:rhodanese-related sulfurtransferase
MIIDINKKTMADLTQHEWTSNLNADKNAIILDVRTPEEVAQGIIPSAIAIDIYKGQEFIDDIEKLDKSKSYYVYCKSGGRSGQACGVMNQLGFKNAYNLIGGFTDWQGEVAI